MKRSKNNQNVGSSYHIRAKKSLGQNFLIDGEALFDIAHAIDVSAKHIIEVGPGYGALTEYLLPQQPRTLTLVELDTDMIRILEDKIGGNQWGHAETVGDRQYRLGDERIRLSIIHQDILQFMPSFDEYAVIANIPYYITSPILFHFLYSDTFAPPESMVIMMQKEVGEKILEGSAKKPHHSLLSLALSEACDDISIVRYVAREAFDPAPKVDSIVLRFLVKKNRNRTQERELIELWKVAFTHPRKTLLSNIKGSRYDMAKIRNTLIELGYDERVRAEAIRQEDWIRFL